MDVYGARGFENATRRHYGQISARLRQPSPSSACAWYLGSPHACAGRNGSASTTASATMRLAADQNIFFVGDSISMQHFRSTACQLSAVQPAPPLVQFNAHQGSTCGAWGHGRGRVCFVRAGGNATGWTVGRAIALLATLVHDGDVIVANEGLHHRALHQSTAASEMAAVGDLARGVDALRGRRVTLLWRETTAQHFDTPTGQYKPTGCVFGRKCGTCRPLVNASVQRERNEQSHAVVRALGVPILASFEASMTMWDEHVERHGSVKHGQTRGLGGVAALDCTHFCEPARLFDSLTRRLLVLAGVSALRL